MMAESREDSTWENTAYISDWWESLGLHVWRECFDDFVYWGVGPGEETNEAQDDGENVHEEPPAAEAKVMLFLADGNVTQGREDESQACATHSAH